MSEIQSMILNSKSDNLPLSIIYSEAESPKGILQCCHGMTEYKNRYISFIEYMADNGYICYIHDMRGHGYSVFSPEDLGYFNENGKKACIDDLFSINQYLRQKYPGLPVFMLGHSMGSLEVRTYCKYHDDTISGLLVLGSPSPVKTVPLGKLLIKFLTSIKGNRYRSNMINSMALGAYNKPFAKESNSKNNWISGNKETVKSFDNSPLCGFTFTLDGFKTLMDLMSDTYNKKGWKISNPDMPIKFFSGEDDSCRGNDNRFFAAVNFMKSVGYSDVNYILYPGLRHEILNEKKSTIVREDILNTLNTWLK